MLPDFLNGTSPDHRGRYLRDIWDFDDKTIEHTHDFIQWLFPLTEKSMSVPGVPTLSVDDIAAIRNSEVTRANLERSAQWYLGFLQRNDHWIKSYDHNHLRITRMIKSLRLLSEDKSAEKIKANLIDFLANRLDTIGLTARTFWDIA